MGVVGTYSGRAQRLRVVCDHYLNLGCGLREESGSRAIWPCPNCGSSSFVASFDEGVAGCGEEGCGVPPSMDLIDLIAYLDEGLQPRDRRSAHEKFAEILEAEVRREQEREGERKERKLQASQERRWQRGLARAQARKEGWPQERLFD